MGVRSEGVVLLLRNDVGISVPPPHSSTMTVRPHSTSQISTTSATKRSCRQHLVRCVAGACVVSVHVCVCVVLVCACVCVVLVCACVCMCMCSSCVCMCVCVCVVLVCACVCMCVCVVLVCACVCV